MRIFTQAFWADWWTCVHCRLVGHLWCAWQDAHDGNYWRRCQDCCTYEVKPYIEMLMQQRAQKRQQMRDAQDRPQ